MTKTVNVWARLGATITVNEELYKTNPEKALIEAVLSGDFKIDGDSYVPADYDNDIDEINFDI